MSATIYTDLKAKRIPDYSIYAIIDRQICKTEKSLIKTLRGCLKAKTEIIQFRDKTADICGFYKNALLIKRLVGKKALFIINDSACVAKYCNADGLHLGQNDLPIKIARKVLGYKKIIGISCHNLKQALLAQKEGADYIGIGPVFSTPTKPEYKPVGLNLIKKVSSILKIPVVAIGGINTKNAAIIKRSGIKNIAAIRAICRSKNITETVRKLRKNK